MAAEASGVAASPRGAVAPTATPVGWQPGLAELAALLDAAWAAQDWDEALHLIDLMAVMDPDYQGLEERRYYAHVNRGFALLAQGYCPEAAEAFRQALTVRPGGEEAMRGQELIAQYCGTPAAPTPTATPPPAATSTPSATAQPTETPPSYTTHVVQPGETLYGLASQYGTSVAALIAANGLSSETIWAGESLRIPSGGSAGYSPVVHIVQPGETLSAIAVRYSTTTWALMAANGLTTHTIWAYQTLYIPITAGTGLTGHVVVAGETLFSIAQRYDTTVDLLMLANHLTSYAIYTQQTLIIPPAGWQGTPDLWPQYPVSVYVVQSGDTLYGIARTHDTTVAALMGANGLTSPIIHAGNVLRVI